jgi:catechol 2,3-dioxygenase-like lactoylglutathione lyase family enzyme
MTNLSGFDFITLLVSDLEASHRFYAETLGLPASAEKRPNAYAFSTTPCPFAIRQSPRPNNPGDGIILWLRSADATALYDELRQRGVPIVDELRQGPFGMTFSIRDPDGYVLTVHDGG